MLLILAYTAMFEFAVYTSYMLPRRLCRLHALLGIRSVPFPETKVHFAFCMSSLGCRYHLFYDFVQNVPGTCLNQRSINK